MSNKSNNSIRNYLWSILVIFLIIGWVYPIIGFIALICMIAPIAVAVFSGKRNWCGMFCPRGIFNDVILSKITRNVKPPALLRSTAFKVAFLVFLIVNLVWGLYNAKNFAQAGFVFVRLVSLTTAIAIVLGFYYQQRTWCGFCPMGFLATLTIKLRKLWSLKEPAPARKPESVQFKNNIILYTGSHCPPCEEIKEILTQKKIKFVEKNIDTDQFSRDELYSIYEITYVPTLVIDGKAYNSKSKEELDKLLGRK